MKTISVKNKEVTGDKLLACSDECMPGGKPACEKENQVIGLDYLYTCFYLLIYGIAVIYPNGRRGNFLLECWEVNK
ncbi:hypothetical protein AAG747_09185 [Rapidithrix thailandica]|uniref:Uncharacterized protein n=1 Tax=Rapidithrix thailandica TaxID=413964 RepID=A0AAW9S6N8_9BACT